MFQADTPPDDHGEHARSVEEEASQSEMIEEPSYQEEANRDENRAQNAGVNTKFLFLPFLTVHIMES